MDFKLKPSILSSNTDEAQENISMQSLKDTAQISNTDPEEIQ